MRRIRNIVYNSSFDPFTENDCWEGSKLQEKGEEKEIEETIIPVYTSCHTRLKHTSKQKKFEQSRPLLHKMHENARHTIWLRLQLPSAKDRKNGKL